MFASLVERSPIQENAVDGQKRSPWIEGTEEDMGCRLATEPAEDKTPDDKVLFEGLSLREAENLRETETPQVMMVTMNEDEMQS